MSPLDNLRKLIGGNVLGSHPQATPQRPAPTQSRPRVSPPVPAKQNPPQKNLFEQFSDFATTANDKTYGSALRAGQMLSQAARNLPTRVIEAINPNDAESRADQLLNKTSSRLGFTPGFKAQIHSSNPTIVPSVSSGALKAGGEAVAVNQPNVLHRLQLTDKFVNDPKHDLDDTIRHEGLHDVYDTLKPESRTYFSSIVNHAMNRSKDQLGPERRVDERTVARDVITPGLRNWLNTRTGDYKSNARANWNDVSSMPEELQHEVHSYIPEYYQTTKQQMPTMLRDYYANYYNTGGRPSEVSRKSSLEQLLGRIWGE